MFCMVTAWHLYPADVTISGCILGADLGAITCAGVVIGLGVVKATGLVALTSARLAASIAFLKQQRITLTWCPLYFPFSELLHVPMFTGKCA